MPKMIDGNQKLVILTVILLIVQVVESRYCSYTGINGAPQFFMCASYEFCCGRSCCRSPTLTFYQLWYFWLSVIFIMLLCSGGGWWYRFKYRDPVYSLSPPGTMAATNTFYYPRTEQVFFQNRHKDYRFPNSVTVMAVPGQPRGAAGETMQPPPPPPPGHAAAAAASATRPSFQPPPPYSDPPPSYEYTMQQGKV